MPTPQEDDFEHTLNSIGGAPSITFRFSGSTCHAELGGASLVARIGPQESVDLSIHTAEGRLYAALTVQPRPRMEPAHNLMEVGAALLWSHWRWLQAPVEARAESIKQIEEYERAVCAATQEEPFQAGRQGTIVEEDAIRFKPGKPIPGAGETRIHWDPTIAVDTYNNDAPEAVCDRGQALDPAEACEDLASVTCEDCLHWAIEAGKQATSFRRPRLG